MSLSTPTPVIPCLYPQVPAARGDAPPARWVPGAVAVSLALASYALSWAGHRLAGGGATDCVLTDVWQAAVFAIASLGTALPGLALGLAGSLWGGAGRLFSLLGFGLNAAFCGVFYLR